MEFFETQGILKPMELLKQGVFLSIRNRWNRWNNSIVFLFKKRFHRFLIPSVFKNSIGFQQDFDKNSIGFKKFLGFQKVPWVFILCFLVKKNSRKFFMVLDQQIHSKCIVFHSIKKYVQRYKKNWPPAVETSAKHPIQCYYF